MEELLLSEDLSKRESTYSESVGDRGAKRFGQFMSIGTHTAIACSDCRDGFADALSWAEFGVS